MSDSKSSGKKPIKEAEELRARNAKLERVSRDITERKKAEEELKQSKEFLVNVINALDDPVFVKDEQCRWVVLNDAACKVMGHSREELIGKTDYDLFPEEQADVFWERDTFVLKHGQTNVNEEEITWHGKLHTISTKKSVFKDSVTGKKFIAGTIRDITERKKAEAEIKKFKTISDKAGYGSAMIDIEGNLTYVNEPFAKIHGYRPHELIGKNLSIFHTKEQMGNVERLIKQLMREGNYVEEEVWHKRKDGTIFPTSMTGTSIRDEKGKPLFMAATAIDITERKQAEEAVSKSEKRYRDLVETSLDMIFMLDMDGNLTFTNRAWSENIGYSYNEAKKINGFELIHPEDLDHVRKRFANVISGKVEYNVEFRSRTKKGEYRNILINGSPVFDSEGKVIGILGSGIDITERKKTEQAIFYERDLLQTLLDNIPDYIYFKDRNRKFVRASNYFCDLFKCSMEDIIGKTDEELFPEEIAAETALDDHNVIETGIPIVNKEEGGESIGGEERWVLTTKLPWHDKEGNIIGLFGVSREITQHKKAEKALRESEEKLRNVVERANDGIAILQDGLLKYVNPRTAGITGYTVEEMINTPFTRYVHPDELPKLADMYERRIAGEEIPSTYETVVRHKDGSDVHIEVNAGLVTYEGKPADLAFARDITERKQAEETLRSERDKLQTLMGGLALTGIGIDVVNIDYRVLFQNQTLIERFGDLTGKLCYEMYMGLKKPCDFCLMIKAIRNKEMESVELTAIDGRNYELLSAPLSNPDGTVDKVIEVVKDITERKQAEEALRNEKEFTETALNAQQDTFFLFEPATGKAIRWNRSFNDITGYADEEISAMPAPGSYYSPEDLKRTSEFIEEVLETGIGAIELELICKDGRKVPTEYNVAVIRDEDGNPNYIISIGRDITERRRAEERLRKYQERLRSLASELSLAEERERRHIAAELHDQISQTLALSKINLQTLGKSAGLADSSRFNEIVESIKSTIEQVQSLTFNLSSPTLYKFGLEKAVDELLREQLQKMGMIYELTDDKSSKPLDEDIMVLLFQSVRELLINIIKHAQAQKVTVAIQRDGDSIRITISDDGVGIDADQFESSGRRIGGFGLFNIRERLNYISGSFDIESQPGKGSRATLIAPLKIEAD